MPVTAPAAHCLKQNHATSAVNQPTETAPNKASVHALKNGNVAEHQDYPNSQLPLPPPLPQNSYAPVYVNQISGTPEEPHAQTLPQQKMEAVYENHPPVANQNGAEYEVLAPVTERNPTYDALRN